MNKPIKKQRTSMRKTFKEWVLLQFGESVAELLNDFHEEDGYADQYINGIWLGFNAGVELSAGI